MPTELAIGALAAALAGGAGASPPPARRATPGSGAAPAGCPSPGRSVAPDRCAYPEDVRAFVRRRELCDHFRGEPWPEGADAAARERRGEILDGVRVHCSGTDARLSRLRHRYANDARVLALLSRYEPRVED